MTELRILASERNSPSTYPNANTFDSWTFTRHRNLQQQEHSGQEAGERNQSDARRRVTVFLPLAQGRSSTQDLIEVRGGFAADTNGDAVFGADADTRAPFRLVRLDGATGAIVRDVQAPIGGTPSTLSLAANGRVLVGGYGSIGGGRVSGRIAEFDASGEPCRVNANIGIFSPVDASAGANGWSVLGTTAFVQSVGNDVFASHFDNDGACSLTDRVFVDGFEATRRSG